MLPQVAFFALGTIMLVSAILVIIQRNAIHSIIWLIVTLFSVSGIFLLLHAEFLFAVQIILYVGGIMVLFLFVVMLVNISATVKQQPFRRKWGLALVVALVVLGQLAYALYRGREVFPLAPLVADFGTKGNTEAVALSLYRDYMLPVEIASLLLLVAMIGAVIMSKRKLE